MTEETFNKAIEIREEMDEVISAIKILDESQCGYRLHFVHLNPNGTPTTMVKPEIFDFCEEKLNMLTKEAYHYLHERLLQLKKQIKEL